MAISRDEMDEVGKLVGRAGDDYAWAAHSCVANCRDIGARDAAVQAKCDAIVKSDLADMFSARLASPAILGNWKSYPVSLTVSGCYPNGASVDVNPETQMTGWTSGFNCLYSHPVTRYGYQGIDDMLNINACFTLKSNAGDPCPEVQFCQGPGLAYEHGPNPKFYYSNGHPELIACWPVLVVNGQRVLGANGWAMSYEYGKHYRWHVSDAMRGWIHVNPAEGIYTEILPLGPTSFGFQTMADPR